MCHLFRSIVQNLLLRVLDSFLLGQKSHELMRIVKLQKYTLCCHQLTFALSLKMNAVKWYFMPASMVKKKPQRLEMK